MLSFLTNVLQSYGINVVTDYRNIDGGSNLRRNLQDLIENSGYFVACFSKEFNRREKSVAYRELHVAIECAKDYPFDRKWIIPIRINKCEVPKAEIGSQIFLTDLHWIDLFPGAKWHEGVESIVRAIDERTYYKPTEGTRSSSRNRNPKEYGI